MALPEPYLAAIRQFEGYTPRAAWDYRQHSVGYGTRARHSGEVIDREEAERRLQTEAGNAAAIVDRFAPGLDEGTRAALTSLTYNAGDEWTRSGLGQAVRAGDMSRARELFLQYNRAGGEMLPGLATRRQQEAAWFGGASAPQPSAAGAPTASPSAAPAAAPASAAPQDVRSIVADLLGQQQQTTQARNPAAEIASAAASDIEPLRLPSMAPRRQVSTAQIRAGLSGRRRIGVM